MSELKPCPFCGASEIVTVRCGADNEVTYDGCDKCGAQGPMILGPRYEGAEWNTRTPATTDAVLVDKRDYMRRLIKEIRKQIAADPETIEAKKEFGDEVTIGKWLNVTLLCSVVEKAALPRPEYKMSSGEEDVMHRALLKSAKIIEPEVDANPLSDDNRSLLNQLQVAESRINILENALRFYANELWWLRARVENRWDLSFGNDDGKTARNALQQLQQQESDKGVTE